MATAKKKRNRATLGFLLPGQDGPVKVHVGGIVYYRGVPCRVVGLDFRDGSTMVNLRSSKEAIRVPVSDLVAVTPEVIELSSRFVDLRKKLADSSPNLSKEVMERLDILWLAGCKDMTGSRGGPKKPPEQVLNELTLWINDVSRAYWGAVTAKIHGVHLLNFNWE